MTFSVPCGSDLTPQCFHLHHVYKALNELQLPSASPSKVPSALPSDAPSNPTDQPLTDPSTIGARVKTYCLSGCDLKCPVGAKGPGWYLPGGNNNEDAELRWKGLELNTNYFTVSMWINREDNDRDIGLFSYGQYPDKKGFMLQMRSKHSSKDFHVRAASNENPNFDSYNSDKIGWTDSQVIGKWMHVAIVKEGDKGLHFYLNGAEAGNPNSDFRGKPLTVANNRHFNVGSWFEVRSLVNHIKYYV